jgi:hypothetical protein
MNKRKIILQFLFLLSFSVYSFELGNNIRPGVLGLGFSTENENHSWYLYGGVLKFTYQSTNGFGVGISPFHFSFMNEGSSYFSFTFINTSFFYNIFRDDNYVLGPFCSINVLKYKNPGFFEVHAGITFSICNISFWDVDLYKDSILGYDFLIVELGYKYTNEGKQGFYAFIGTDLLSGFYNLAAVAVGGDAEKYQKEHPTY